MGCASGRASGRERRSSDMLGTPEEDGEVRRRLLGAPRNGYTASDQLAAVVEEGEGCRWCLHGKGHLAARREGEKWDGEGEVGGVRRSVGSGMRGEGSDWVGLSAKHGQSCNKTGASM